MHRTIRRSAAMALFGLFIVLVHAQTAPDIARGMSGEAVIRTYGWPKGKSAAENREIWMYDRFQVILDSGHVVSVSPIIPVKSQPSPPSVFQASTPPRRALPSSLPSQPIIRSQSPRTNLPVIDDHPFHAPVPSREPAAAVVAYSPSFLRTFWPAIVFACLAIVWVVMAAERKRLALETRERATQMAAVAPPPSKSWQESVAEKLARTASVAPVSYPEPEAEPPFFEELTPPLLERLEWKRFELLVALYFGETGVRTEAADVGPDGGVDVRLFRPGELQPYAFVQCKAWEKDVGVALIRELFGVMSASKVPEGFFVTTGDYTDDARTFAAECGITAIAGPDLIKRFGQLTAVTQAKILTAVTEGDYTTPTCPSCGIKLVLREGNNAFWGCRHFPRCTVKLYPRKSRRS